MKALLFELGVEEIPARLLSRAHRELGERLIKALAGANLEYADLRTFATPRRLALSISIADAQPDTVEERLGPPARIAFDQEGQPTKAAIGFAQRQGVSVDALERRTTPKGDYLGVTVETLGQKSDVLLPGILQDIITQLHWPKAMRWASGRETFIRPVQWILACFDGAVVPITFAGVESGETTRGHRFMAPNTVVVHDVESYLAELRARFVEPDPERRKAEIKRQTEALAAEHGVEAIITSELLEEVTGLVEWPFVHLGDFDEDALGLPSEVLITSMNVHQRYFAVRSRSGALAAHFIVVAGTQVEDPAVVIAGNARVLAARLADARFFYDADIGQPLDTFVPALQGRRFLEGLGTMADKATRLQTMSQRIATHINEDPTVAERAGRAGWLAKADLATAMVGEFAKLQGVMGQDYATRSGESKAVADAVFEHYLPRFAGDELAQSDEGTSVALADRMDSLMGCFTLGLEPTGSADPYALRRQALGVVRMQRHSERVPALSTLIDVAAETYRSAGVAIDAEAMSRLTVFFRGRMKAAFASHSCSAAQCGQNGE